MAEIERIEARLDQGPEGLIDAWIEARAKCPWSPIERRRWLIGRKAGVSVRKMMDANGQYLYEASIGEPGRLLGLPVHFTDDPDMVGRLVLEVE
jgi:HK97 family phage major capsid protein